MLYSKVVDDGEAAEEVRIDDLDLANDSTGTGADIQTINGSRSSVTNRWWNVLGKHPVKLLMLVVITILAADVINLVVSKFVGSEIKGLDVLLESHRNGFHTPLHFKANFVLQSFLHSALIKAGNTKCRVIAASTHSDGSMSREIVTDVSLMSDVIMPNLVTYPKTHRDQNKDKTYKSMPPQLSHVLPEFSDTRTNDDIEIALSDTSTQTLQHIIAYPTRFFPEAYCQADITVYAFSVIPVEATVYMTWDAQRGAMVSVIKPTPELENYDQTIAHLSTVGALLANATGHPALKHANASAPAPKTSLFIDYGYTGAQAQALHDMMHQSKSMFSSPSFSNTSFTYDNATVDATVLMCAGAWVPFPIRVHVASFSVGVLDDNPVAQRSSDDPMWSIDVSSFVIDMQPGTICSRYHRPRPLTFHAPFTCPHRHRHHTLSHTLFSTLSPHLTSLHLTPQERTLP